MPPAQVRQAWYFGAANNMHVCDEVHGLRKLRDTPEEELPPALLESELRLRAIEYEPG